MTKQEWEAIRDLASLMAEMIRRMGASYGSAEEWREGITLAVRIMERASVEASRAEEDVNENPPEGWEECGCCGCWHPGDGKAYECRDDANRWPFATHA